MIYVTYDIGNRDKSFQVTLIS